MKAARHPFSTGPKLHTVITAIPTFLPQSSHNTGGISFLPPVYLCHYGYLGAGGHPSSELVWGLEYSQNRLLYPIPLQLAGLSRPLHNAAAHYPSLGLWDYGDTAVRSIPGSTQWQHKQLLRNQSLRSLVVLKTRRGWGMVRYLVPATQARAPESGRQHVSVITALLWLR